MHPILFRIPILDFPVHSFGAALAIAFLVGMWRLDRYAGQVGLDRKRVSDLTVWIVVSILVGCRTLYFVVHPDELMNAKSNALFQFFKVWEGGMVFYGGFVLALVVGFWKAKSYGLPLLPSSDIALVATFLGVFIGRWGCLLVGDDFGRLIPEDHWWPFKLYVPAELPERSLFPPSFAGKYVHPTQIYMSVNGLVLFVVGHRILKRQRAWGTATASLLVLYSITRSIIEVFRGDWAARGGFLGVSTSQWISIPIGLAGLTALVWLRGRREDGPVFAAQGEPEAEPTDAG